MKAELTSLNAYLAARGTVNYMSSTREGNKGTIVGPDGKLISLSSLPLVAFKLSCGHLGRDWGVLRGDLVFCEECGTSKRVRKIIAQ